MAAFSRESWVENCDASKPHSASSAHKNELIVIAKIMQWQLVQESSGSPWRTGELRPAVRSLAESICNVPTGAMKVLPDVANELRKAPVFASLIPNGPEMLVLDRFGDNSSALKFVLQTDPLKRWPVQPGGW